MSFQTKERSMHKVAMTALAGTSIEWYDFFLYGAAAALVFPPAFFGEVSDFSIIWLAFSRHLFDFRIPFFYEKDAQ